eukprot:sb/3467240/
MASKGDTTALQMWMDCGVSPSSVADYGARTPLEYAANDATRAVLARRCVDSRIFIENHIALDLDKPVPRFTRIRSWPTPNVDPVVLGEVLNSEQNPFLAAPLVCLLMLLGDGEMLREYFRLHSTSLHTLRDYDGRTPLHMACSTGNIAAVRLLLWNKVDINAMDRFGSTPLLEACRSKHEKVARYLVRRGGTLPTKYTPDLYWAVWDSEYEMVTRLVECGADPGRVDYAGRSPLDIAKPAMREHIEGLVSEGGGGGRNAVVPSPETPHSSPIIAKKRTSSTITLTVHNDNQIRACDGEDMGSHV